MLYKKQVNKDMLKKGRPGADDGPEIKGFKKRRVNHGKSKKRKKS